jgi:hypothetical protein
MLRFWIPFALTALVLLGCGAASTEISPEELPFPEEQLRVGAAAKRVGIIAPGVPDLPFLEVPSSVRRGEMAEFFVTTIGGGCVVADTTVWRSGAGRIDVFPYQRVFTPGPGSGCTADLRFERRAIRVMFSEAGRVVIRVIGRTQFDRAPEAFEQRITVRE